MRILDIINRTTPFLENHGVGSPRLNIELMLAHMLGKRRLDLYMEFERELDEPALEKLREMVKRRAAGEPLQYITGEAEFCGLKFAVDRQVLIPRPETELLVETVLEQLKEGVRSQKSEVRIIDLCTGSGCVAVALAKNLENTTIFSTDISTDALAVARRNAARHGVEKKIRFLQGDLLSVIPDSLRADVLVSNPPYIASGELVGLPKEVRDFEPVQALVAGEDGLKVIRRIVANASRFLLPDGILALELGAGQRVAVEQLCAQHGLQMVKVVKDLQGHERVIVARAR
ncbi:MAG: peptide chain release factor N(5)-glutamine methyltransferase [Verrucomicrobiia bacterium]